MKRIFILKALAEFEDKKSLPAGRQGSQFKLCGWVDARRDHGKLIFIDLRDKTGVLQIVFNQNQKETFELANSLRTNDVIEIEGEIKLRPEKMFNPDTPTGKIELETQKLKILNKSETPPFDISSDGRDIGEEHRLKYRCLDLKRPRLQKNLIARHKIENYIRGYLTKQSFIEIETPVLTKSTPEGARDYVVPSRLQKGKFYALPQSPQQYKQLLMVAGLERYFQIVRCFRDEDTRGDRQPEFTQLDIEMSFVEQEDILNLVEDLFTSLIKEMYPEKKIVKIPWPRLAYQKVMEKYGTDKPDLRKNKNDPNELAFVWVLDWPLFGWNEEEKRWDSHHHPFTAPRDEDIPLLDKDPAKARSRQHDLVLNGYEVGGGSIRIHNPKIQEKVFELVGLKKEEIWQKFGHLLEAFRYGVPPHGGIASGLDRVIAILQNEPNIREVIAFPKTGDGRDLMMNSPSEISREQLKELGLEIKKRKIK